ncbi:MAG: hypothetical protein HPY81_02955 [Firmicutes bacterium]|nr:hypothetical protein [Bacillota bacterium]
MKALFTLTPAEAKRLIAKGVSQLPVVQSALQNGRIGIAGGTTNAYIVEELLGVTISKERYTAGVITQGRQCLTPAAERIAPYVLVRGKVSDQPWDKAIEEFSGSDVFIKGANAIDSEGNVGILMANPTGGTIGRMIGLIASRGCQLVIPVGLEKMIPSVRAAAQAAGIQHFDYHFGKPVGFMPLMMGTVVTEIEALKLVTNVKATCIGAGGVGGSEGATVLAVEGSEAEVKATMELVRLLKREKPIPALKQACTDCKEPCHWTKKTQ